MKRRVLILTAAALVSCGKQSKSFEDILPRQIPGGWQRTDLQSLTEIPEPVSRFGVDKAVQTTYKGTGTIHVRAFRMRSAATPFEVMQKWRLPDGIPAYRGEFFFVANPEGADRGAVAAVLRALEQAAE